MKGTEVVTEQSNRYGVGRSRWGLCSKFASGEDLGLRASALVGCTVSYRIEVVEGERNQKWHGTRHHLYSTLAQHLLALNLSQNENKRIPFEVNISNGLQTSNLYTLFMSFAASRKMLTVVICSVYVVFYLYTTRNLHRHLLFQKYLLRPNVVCYIDCLCPELEKIIV